MGNIQKFYKGIAIVRASMNRISREIEKTDARKKELLEEFADLQNNLKIIQLLNRVEHSKSEDDDYLSKR